VWAFHETVAILVVGVGPTLVMRAPGRTAPAEEPETATATA
jgi:hypothetical protein